MGQEYDYSPQYYEQEGNQQPEQHQDNAAKKLFSDVRNGAGKLFRKVERGVQQIPTEPIKRNAQSIGGSVQRVGEAQLRQYQTPDGRVDGVQVAKDVAPYFIPGIGPAKAVMGITGLGGGGNILRNMGVGVVQDQINVRRAERAERDAAPHDVIRYQNRDPHQQVYGQDSQQGYRQDAQQGHRQDTQQPWQIEAYSQPRAQQNYPPQRELPQRELPQRAVAQQPDLQSQIAKLLQNRNTIPTGLTQHRYESIQPPDATRQIAPQEQVRHIAPMNSSSIDYSTTRYGVPQTSQTADATIPAQKRTTVSTKLGSLGIH